MNNLLTVSLWRDEAFSAIIAQYNIFDIIRIVINDTSPPLYYIILHVWFSLFGDSEVSLRSLSFVFYLVIAYFVYKITRMTNTKSISLLATIAVLVHPIIFYYAFEGRMYSMMIASSTASLYFLLKNNRLGFVVSTVIALYTHHFALFFLIPSLGYTAYMMYIKNKSYKDFYKTFIAIGILYLPWIIPLISQTQKVSGGFWIESPSLKNLKELIYEYFGYWTDHMLSAQTVNIVFLLLIFRKWKDKKSALFATWFIVPIVVAWVFSQIATPIFFNRYLVAVLPALILILATNQRRISLLLFSILITLYSVITLHQFTHPTKQEFKFIAEKIKSSESEYDFVINAHDSLHFWESKYYGLSAPYYLEESQTIPFFMGTALIEDEDIIYSIPENIRRVYLISSSKEYPTLDKFAVKAVYEVDSIYLYQLEKVSE